MTTTKLALTTALLLGSAMAMAHTPAGAQTQSPTAEECSILKQANLQGLAYVLDRQKADLAIMKSASALTTIAHTGLPDAARRARDFKAVLEGNIGAGVGTFDLDLATRAGKLLNRLCE